MVYICWLFCFMVYVCWLVVFYGLCLLVGCVLWFMFVGWLCFMAYVCWLLCFMAYVCWLCFMAYVCWLFCFMAYVCSLVVFYSVSNLFRSFNAKLNCKKLDARMLWAILNKSWRQHPTKQKVYGHLPPIKKTIKIRRTRHAGQWWKSRDELIIDVLLWTPSHGRAKAEHPAWTYIQ